MQVNDQVLIISNKIFNYHSNFTNCYGKIVKAPANDECSYLVNVHLKEGGYQNVKFTSEELVPVKLATLTIDH